jgi:hypothetical protein
MATDDPAEESARGKNVATSDAPAVSTSVLYSSRGTEQTVLAERDIALYLSGLPRWGEHAGEHVLIYDGQVHGFYATRDDALTEGFRRFGLVAFLVKQVDLDEAPRPLVQVML